MMKTWLLEFRVQGKEMYFTDIEGSIALTMDVAAAHQFDSKEQAETYLGMLHQEFPNHKPILNKLEAVPYGYS